MENGIEKSAVNTLRVLACEAIATAKTGHSGIALGAAPIMYAIYKSMNVVPSAPAWFNRDRFVLSAGHGSALLYATLHAFGFKDIDLSSFRQMDSPLTGHPELNEKIGVDCSTGPLGQGIAMAVGIAAAEKVLGQTYNNDIEIVDHYTYCLVGDGCLMEGVSYEACNLAGLWELNKLIVLYDSNNVTLDGSRTLADGEDVVKRFRAMRWNVLSVPNADQAPGAIEKAIKKAKKFTNAPTLIIVQTEIGYGAKNAGSPKAHGQVLTLEETRKLRTTWGLKAPIFETDGEVAEHFESLVRKKARFAGKWKRLYKEYKVNSPEKYAELSQFIDKPKINYTCKAPGKEMALRDAGYLMLNQIAKQNPRLWGGSADVASTTKAYVDGGDDISFGVREFAMAAISNGIALHGFTPYCSTFLAFSDYCKPAIRLTAMMNLPVTYIFTHDGLGNAPDGPTHQANEHIAALRMIPNCNVFRPADDLEAAAVYEYVFEQQTPACIVLGRGNVPSPSGANEKFGVPHAVLLSSGAEVSLCVEAQKLLEKTGVRVNVVSIPCLEVFNAGVLNRAVPVLAVEMGNSMPWWALFGRAGLTGDVIGFDDFGASAKPEALMEKLGFTAIAIAERVVKLLG